MEAGKHNLTGNKTPLTYLHMCGDYTFPGIGVPVKEASRAIYTNNLISISDHWNMLDKITPSLCMNLESAKEKRLVMSNYFDEIIKTYFVDLNLILSYFHLK